MSSPRNTAGHALTKGWKWLDGFAGFFEAIVTWFYKIPGTGWIKTLLHGTWPLRHPLHPAITDITIGAYTAAVALDVYYLVTGDAIVHAADFVITLAFLSSLIAILSGLTDWRDTFGEEKRTGMLHALVMVIATVLFFVSIAIRLHADPDQRALAITFSGIGWAIMLVGAFFGGEMPYGYGTQINRQAWTEHPTKWEKLDIAAKGLEDRTPVVGKTKKGAEIFVAKVDDKIYAIANKCTHAGGPLNEGKWVGGDRCEIQCPWHGSVFCVKDGEVKGGPATFPEPAFEVRETDSGFVEVRAKD